MTEVIETPLKASVSVERKVNLGQYESVTFKAWVEVGADGQLAINDQQIFEALQNVQTAVLVTAGKEFSYGEDGRIVEKVAVQEVKESRAPASRPAQKRISQQARETLGAETVLKVVGANQGPLPAWLAEAAAAKGVAKVFDNRVSEFEGPGLGKTGKPKPWFVSADEDRVPFWPPADGGNKRAAQPRTSRPEPESYDEEPF